MQILAIKMPPNSSSKIPKNAHSKQDKKRGHPFGQPLRLSENFYTWSYFEAARSSRKHSILGVCEHFGNKADAERAQVEVFSH